MATLKQAVRGLVYPSESEYPFKAFVWDISDLTSAVILAQTKHADDTALQTINLEEFFAPVIQVQDWFGAEEQASVAKFQQLKQILETSLTKIQVYRIGEIEISVYIVGQTPEGQWAGISTKVVET